jgi:ATP-dependent Lon protease
MSALDVKVNEAFPGLAVRKDLVARVRGNAVVPGYVLEFLLAQYCATDDDATIEVGIESVRKVLAEHYVHRGEAELVKSTIRDRGRYRIIDKVEVVLDERRDIHTAAFANLGLKGVPIDDRTVKLHPKLLTGGVWCMADIEYSAGEAHDDRWIIAGVKPIQLGQFDFDGYLGGRRQFSTDEWIDLLIQSIGFAPEMLSQRAKLLQIVRLVPFVERNYNLVELGPKGTGKSHIYSEFSPHGMLISGGEVTAPKLFVNNTNGRIGLVGYWHVVAFDEFAGQKRVDKNLVDIMKNYMANKTFSRGVQTMGAEASMVFIGNTARPVPTMLAHSDLFEVLPDSYHDSAYLDRLHHYLPGWEVDTIRSELFTGGYGFVVDYLAEALAHMRNQDFSDAYTRYLALSEDISTRDRDGVRKTFSGLMKLIHPTGEASEAEIEEILRFAVEGRKRVKDQILRIDKTMDPVRFGYTDNAGTWHDVATQEELDYPHLYNRGSGAGDGEAAVSGDGENTADARAVATTNGEEATPAKEELFTGARDVPENAIGYSFGTLLMPYLLGAKRIEITDPYIRAPHQLRNLFDLLTEIVGAKPIDEVLEIHLITSEETSRSDWTENQLTGLRDIQVSALESGVDFTCEFDSTKHDREITTNTGWRILLGRGLDIFQPFTSSSRYDLRLRLQDRRRTKACTITYLRS